MVSRLEYQHQEELAKLSAANQQYELMVREQSQKAASQEKKTSEMFEQTLSEMKEMVERSRETREKERKAASAMLESSNQVCESQKRDLENAQQELRKVTDQLSKAEIQVQNLEYSLSDAEEQLQLNIIEKQKFTDFRTHIVVEAKFASVSERQLSRSWRQWAVSARTGARRAQRNNSEANEISSTALRT